MLAAEGAIRQSKKFDDYENVMMWFLFSTRIWTMAID
jgi:hypothetical protein